MSFRRFAAILLTTTVAFVFTSVLAFATPAMAATITVGDYTYETSGTTATVTDYSGGAVANIPETFDDGGTTYTVTTIGDYAFDNKNLTEVTIPNSVTTIGFAAFYNNNLTEVTIPNSVTTIGDIAFYNNNLTTVTIPDSVTTIGIDAFRDNNLTTVTIPDSVTTIGVRAFASNPNFSSAVFNGNAPTAGTDVFGSASPLPTVFYYDGATGFAPLWTSSNYPTQVVSGAASSLTITPSGPVLPDGTSTYTATLTVMSGNPGTPVAGFPSDFTIPAGVTASATRCITDAAGVCTITLTSTTAGTYTISTLAGAAPANLTANATFSALPSLAATGIETSPVPYAVGGGVLVLGILLTVIAARRKKTVR